VNFLIIAVVDALPQEFFTDIPLGQNLQFFFAAAVKIKLIHYQNAQNYQSEKNGNQKAAVPKLFEEFSAAALC